MKTLLFIFICFLVGVLIYLLIRSYCVCNVVEGTNSSPGQFVALPPKNYIGFFQSDYKQDDWDDGPDDCTPVMLYDRAGRIGGTGYAPVELESLEDSSVPNKNKLWYPDVTDLTNSKYNVLNDAFLVNYAFC